MKIFKLTSQADVFNLSAGRKLKCTLAVHALQPVVRQTSPRTHLLLRERFRNMASAGVSHGNTTHEAGMRLRCHAMPADKHDSQSSVGVVIVDHGSRKKTSNNMLVGLAANTYCTVARWYDGGGSATDPAVHSSINKTDSGAAQHR